MNNEFRITINEFRSKDSTCNRVYLLYLLLVTYTTMKIIYRYFLFLLGLMLLSLSANAQWFKLKPYIDIYAGDTNVYGGFQGLPIVAGDGEILYGEVWGAKTAHSGGEDLVESGNDLFTARKVFGYGGIGQGWVYSIASKNDSTISFIANNGALLGYTTNNYKTANVVNLNIFVLPSYSIPTCFSQNYIYSVVLAWYSSTDSVFIFRTDISSATDTKIVNLKYVYPTYIQFTSDSVGYMICSYRGDTTKSVLARTSDSGTVWTDCFVDSVHIITGFSFPSPSVGYITENDGSIYKTINAGGTWAKLTSPSAVSLYCVSFTNDSLGYVGGKGGVLYKTIDGGTKWTTETSGDATTINQLFTFDTVAYFIDTNQAIYKNIKPTGIEDLSTDKPIVKVYPNPSSGIFTIKSSAENANSCIEVYNMLGEKVYSGAFQHQASFQINLTGEPNGMYFYRVTDKQRTPFASGKLLIQK